MTNTPETDELRDDIWATSYVEGSDFAQMFEHSRKLERERDEAREKIEMLGIRYAAAEIHHETNMQEVTEQRNRLAVALRECLEDSMELKAERDWWSYEPKYGRQKRYQETVNNITRANETLQSLNSPNAND